MGCEMWQDPIVEETRESRRQIVEECGEDIHEFFEFTRARELQHVEDVVTLEQNAPEPDERSYPS